MVLAGPSSGMHTPQGRPDTLQPGGRRGGGEEQGGRGRCQGPVRGDNRVAARARAAVHRHDVDVPVPQVPEQIVEVIYLVPLERISVRTVEQVVDVPVPRL